MSRALKLDLPLVRRKKHPIEFEKTKSIDAELTDLIVPYESGAVGKRIIDLKVPEKCLIMLISRGDKYVIPSGSTVIEAGDVLLVLANSVDLAVLQKTLAHLEKES